MSLELSGLLFLVLWALAAMRGLSAAVFFTLLTIPFGAAAVINIPGSGLSLLALQVTAALTTLVGVLRVLTHHGETPLRLSAPIMAGVLLCIYGILSAFLMPRLFHGDVLITPYGVAVDGVRVSEAFFTTLIPLAPTSSNISQPAYLVASVAFLIVMVSVARRMGPDYLMKALLAAGAINVFLGILDFLRADVLLAVIRTADYAITPDWSIGGADRLIGGFPEPSAFGSVSVIFASIALSLYLDRRNLLIGLLGLSSAVLGVLALSSTALFGLAVLLAWLLLRTASDILRGRGGRRAGAILTVAAFASVIVTLALVLTPAGIYLLDMADALIFSKADSASGLERGFWARDGIRVFTETYGLGAGLGSVRSNGIVPAVLANVGIPGAVLLAVMLWLTFLRRLPAAALRAGQGEGLRILIRASAAGAITSLAMLSIAAIVVDPGILFFSLAAIALASREQLEFAISGWRPGARRAPTQGGPRSTAPAGANRPRP